MASKVHSWMLRYRVKLTQIGHMLEAVTVLVLLLGGGAGSGYLFCQWQSRDMLAEQREDHQREIERLQDAYTRTLEALTPKVSQAATAVAEAAEASAQTAKASAETAKAVKRAATRAAPAPAAPAPAKPVTEAERLQINRDIEAANRKVREARK